MSSARETVTGLVNSALTAIEVTTPPTKYSTTFAEKAIWRVVSAPDTGTSLNIKDLTDIISAEYSKKIHKHSLSFEVEVVTAAGGATTLTTLRTAMRDIWTALGAYSSFDNRKYTVIPESDEIEKDQSGETTGTGYVRFSIEFRTNAFSDTILN